MTVLENLMLGAYSRAGLATAPGEPGRVFTLFPKLAQRQQQLAGR